MAQMAPGEEHAPGEPQEMEVFFLFTRAPRRRPERVERPERSPREEARKPKPKPHRGEESRQGKPRHGDGGNRKPAPKREEHVAQARPQRSEKPIDPDNPFAALMALKLRS
jgi:ATP-dependent RNA helicase SUPV3L1/SUV3